MTEASGVSLVFFTGMAADARLLEPQRRLPCRLMTPNWIEPEANETLPHYARRMADRIPWPERFMLGGVSFGGMVAAELASQVRPAGLVMVASALSARSIPSMLRFARALIKVIPDTAARKVDRLSRPFLSIFGDFSDAEQALFADMLARTSMPTLRRMTEMVFAWEGVREVACKRFWIHGGRDLIIPLRKVRPDRVIPDAGHLINWTHAEAVNEGIAEFMNTLEARE